ncbi:MAG: endonuclease/exonuclease/phosphatase family protein [Candidatus Saccharimonas sp.]
MKIVTISRKNVLSSIISSMIIIVAIVVACPPFPPTASAAASDSVVTLNIWGSLGHKGKTKDVTNDVVAIAKNNKPFAIGLQEVCGKQHRSIREALKKLGYTGTFTETRQSGMCNDKSKGNKFGNSIFIRGRYTNRTRTALPWGKNKKGTTGREPRAMLCVTANKTRYCTVHLATRNPDRENQLTKIARTLEPWAKKGAVVLMGDFNVSSATPVKTITFLKACTTPGRIDYTLSTDARACSTLPAPSSDHKFAILSQ